MNAHASLGQLTVLIGANASGKSNFIKALQFISSVPKIGLESAVISFGNSRSLLPRFRTDSKHQDLVINYSTILNSPRDYPEKKGAISVDHSLSLGFKTKGGIARHNEKVKYNQALAVAKIVQSRIASKKSDPMLIEEVDLDSNIEIARRHGYPDKIDYHPDIKQGNIGQFLAWFGMSYLSETVKTKEALKQFLLTIEGRSEPSSPSLREAKREQSPESLLGPASAPYLAFSSQAVRFKEMVSSIKRYDFLQDELRKEQQSFLSRELSPTGQNMPAVLRAIKQTNAETRGWDNVLSILSQMNPYVRSADVSSLQTGKDFIEFVESRMSKPIESWEASDGTLRGLAIMLALEAHPKWSTIIIEEPEQNLHPWAIRGLMDNIRRVISDRHLQVVITTHSQQVLESVDPDEVLVVTRSDEEGTKLNSLKDLLPSHTIEMGEVGRLWVKGLLGGVPSA